MILTWQQKRAMDSIVNISYEAIGSVCFGFWQHSWRAGLFMWVVLHGLLNIPWAIEYGAQHGLDEALAKELKPSTLVEKTEGESSRPPRRTKVDS